MRNCLKIYLILTPLSFILNGSGFLLYKEGAVLTYLIGAVSGLIYGVLLGFLKRILFLPKNTEPEKFMKETTVYMLISMVINVVSLLAIFFLRNVLPFSFEAMLIAAAVGLSLTGQVSSILKTLQKNQTEVKNEDQ